jgi:hypothetical protein
MRLSAFVQVDPRYFAEETSEGRHGYKIVYTAVDRRPEDARM